MNWLTLRMAALDSFGGLHEVGVPRPDSSLRRLPFRLVEQALVDSFIKVDLSPVEDSIGDAHLFTEDLESASRRMGAARIVTAAGLPTDRPLRFTTGLVDGAGTVLYLPDDDSDVLDLQLFTGPESGPIERLRFTGEITLEAAHPTEVRQEAPQACADGPCAEWMERCGGDGCFCHKFVDVEDRVRDRIRRALQGAERHEPSLLNCYPEDPFGGQG
jgi:hypothetical protein